MKWFTFALVAVISFTATALGQMVQQTVQWPDTMLLPTYGGQQQFVPQQSGAYSQDCALVEALANRLTTRRADIAVRQVELQELERNNAALRNYICQRFCAPVQQPMMQMPTNFGTPMYYGAPQGRCATDPRLFQGPATFGLDVRAATMPPVVYGSNVSNQEAQQGQYVLPFRMR